VNTHVRICSAADPNGQNWDWVKALRAREHARNTGVIVISSVTDQEAILGAVRASVDDSIVMPLPALAFEERIGSLLEKQRLAS